jgi:ketosteroid isomerase-like protein
VRDSRAVSRQGRATQDHSERDTGRVSQTNGEVARALNKLWNEGVRDIPTEYLDPAVELESPFSSVSGQPYRGYTGIKEWVGDVDEQFSEWQNRLDDVREVGNAVITVGVLHGRGRGSGIEFDQPCALVMDFGSDNRITRVRIYWDVDAALKAVGLAE